MSADLRMNLESELDTLSEDQVESWLQRCFEDCDPRFDSDWLNGIFELALMQFPDNYEVRAAASKAAIMDAQRLYDEGDQAEAVSRLERLLENDTYCTEAFELLERFMQGGQVEAPPPPPAAVEAPEEVAVADLSEAELPEELDFLNDDLLADLSLEPDLPLELDSLDSAAPVEPLEEVIAAEPELPAVELEPIQPEPAPVREPEVEVEVAAAPAEPVSPPVAVPATLSPSASDWKSAVMLPSDAGPIEANLLSILPNLAERLRNASSYRPLTLLLADLHQRDSGAEAVRVTLHETLRAWAQQLESQSRASEAAQVAQFALSIIPESQPWAQPLSSKFPAALPSLPTFSQAPGASTPTWMNWVEPLKADPSRYQEAGEVLKDDPTGLQSLFRHLAVHHASHPEHVLNLGWAYSVTGQHALAMVHTQRALSMQSSARAQQLLRQIYTDLGQPELAQRV
jgi:tetratricopeptide (TPR) repeat protein